MREEDRLKLNELNRKVEDAIQERSDWLDSKMDEYAEIKVGEEIWDLVECKKLGVVAKLYRYFGDDRSKDKHLSIDYEYQTGECCFDNTSRQPHIRVGTKEDAIRYHEEKIKMLKTEK